MSNYFYLFRKLLKEESISALARQEGLNLTNLPNVVIKKTTKYQPLTPLCYQKGIVIVGQGSKSIYLGGNRLDYNKDNYLVLSVSLPAEGEVFASEEEPFLSPFIGIDMQELGRIIDKMENQGNRAFSQEKHQQALFVSKTTPEIKDRACRLLKTLQSPIESEVMGKGIVKEILYRVFCSENAASLYSLFVKNSNLSLGTQGWRSCIGSGI